MTILGQKNYREILQRILTERQAANPLYSLRALAKRAGLSPSMLSEVIAGKKSISSSRAEPTANGLGLLGAEKEYFITLIELENAWSAEIQTLLSRRLEELAQNLSAPLPGYYEFNSETLSYDDESLFELREHASQFLKTCKRLSAQSTSRKKRYCVTVRLDPQD